jgi:hypothetical protein
VRHSFLRGVFFNEILEVFSDDGNRGFAEGGFQINTVANDRWRAVASMPNSHNHRVPFGSDFRP